MGFSPLRLVFALFSAFLRVVIDLTNLARDILLPLHARSVAYLAKSVSIILFSLGGSRLNPRSLSVV